MKLNIQSYIILFALITIIFSCKNTLEEDPETFFSEASVFSTEAGVETAVNGLYATFSGPQYYGSSWTTFMLPVSGVFFSSQNANRDATGLNTTSSNPLLRNIWSKAYETINTANIIINNLENTTLELDNKEAALGNAYFIRGVTYFDLVRMFSGVPIRLEPVTDETIHAPKSSAQEVYNLLIADLEKAKTMLPERGLNINGRPANLAANVYLAKVYMTLAGAGDNTAWTKAQTEISPVIGAYSLTPTYAELFMPQNENTVESIFELQYDHTGGTRNSDNIRNFTPSKSIYAAANVTTFGRIRPNKEIFDNHIATYPDDPRIATTFLFDTYEKIDGGNQKIYPEKTNGNQGFAIIRKWFDPTYNGVTTARNYFMLRYADVLLMSAEIENEINGPDNAYQYVNEVLARARDIDGDGISDSVEPADWSGMTQEDFRSSIMQERIFELLSEGQEWFDTRRRGYQFLLDNVITPHNSHSTFDSTTDFVYPTDEKNMLLPIPLSEISGNQLITNEDQNPGY